MYLITRDHARALNQDKLKSMHNLSDLPHTKAKFGLFATPLEHNNIVEYRPSVLLLDSLRG